eukprot:COSAG01_NODE_3931_length_5524_cov_20.370507_3_plen_85_part_00
MSSAYTHGDGTGSGQLDAAACHGDLWCRGFVWGCVNVNVCWVLAICGALVPPHLPVGPHSRVTAPVSPVFVPVGSVGGRRAGGA